MNDKNFYDAMNLYERKAEARFPGYKGPVYGEYTEGKPCLEEYCWRTQVAFEDGSVLWLDVRHYDVKVGDVCMIAERMTTLKVTHVGVTFKKEYFDKSDAIPHKFGTLLDLNRRMKWEIKD